VGRVVLGGALRVSSVSCGPRCARWCAACELGFLWAALCSVVSRTPALRVSSF